MTYTSDNSQFQFFVVGGNSDGTETGRIYFYRATSEASQFLFDNGTSTTNWASWTVSYWTSETRLVLSASNYPVTDAHAAHVGVSTVADLHTLGFDGTKLFTGVKIL